MVVRRFEVGQKLICCEVRTVGCIPAARTTIVFMIAQGGDDRNTAGQRTEFASIVFPEFIPITLFTTAFHEVARDHQQIRAASCDDTAVLTIANGLIDKIIDDAFWTITSHIHRPRDRWTGRRFRFRFRIRIDNQSNGLVG